jgi:hypothetical protein
VNNNNYSIITYSISCNIDSYYNVIIITTLLFAVKFLILLNHSIYVQLMELEIF